MSQVTSGDKIPLNLVLEDGATDQYPQAHVFNNAGTEIAGSPFDLTHVSIGLYKNLSATAVLADTRYYVVYEVYTDAGHTDLSGLYAPRTEDVFDVVPGLAVTAVTRVELRVPDVLELPTVGTKTYRFVVYLYDGANNLRDPDSNQVFIHVEDINQSEIVPLTALTREQAGVYWYKYTVSAGDNEQPLWTEFTYVSNGISYLVGEVTETERMRAALDVIETQRLTAARATKLDFLDAAITTRQSTTTALAQYNNIQVAVAATDTDVNSVLTKIGPVTGGTVASHLNLIKSETDKIGNPATGTVGGALAQIAASTILIGPSATGTLTSDIAAVYSRLGAPAGASVSADIAAIKSDTLRIGVPVHGTLAGDFNFLFSEFGTPVSTFAGDITALQGTISALSAKVGTPVNASIALDIAAVKGDTAITNSRLSAGRASNLDNLDVFVSSRESESSASSRYGSDQAKLDAILAGIGAIPNNTTFVGIVPSVLVLPASGTKDYKFYVNLFNSDGTPGDADAAITLRVTDVNGSTLAGPTAMQHLSTGRYSYSYPVLSSDQERSIYVFFDYDKGSTHFTQTRVAEVQEFESKLDTLLTRLTISRTNALDLLDAPVSAVQTKALALSQQSTLIADFVSTSTDLASLLARVGIPTGGSVSQDIANLQLYLNRIGSPANGTLAADLAAIQAQTNYIGTPTYGTLAGDDTQILGQFATALAAIATVKTDTLHIGIPVGGTVATGLADIRSKMGVLAGATTLESLFTNVDLTPVLTRLGTPVGASVSADIAALQTAVGGVSTQVTAVKVDTQQIGAPTGASIAADIAAIKADTGAFSGSIASLSTAITNQFSVVGTGITAISTKLGTPTSDLATEIAAILADEIAVGSPLQSTDSRLNFLDVAISSRATPADLLSVTAGLNLLEITGVLDSVNDELVTVIDGTTDELIGLVEDA